MIVIDLKVADNRFHHDPVIQYSHCNLVEKYYVSIHINLRTWSILYFRLIGFFVYLKPRGDTLLFADNLFDSVLVGKCLCAKLSPTISCPVTDIRHTTIRSIWPWMEGGSRQTCQTWVIQPSKSCTCSIIWNCELNFAA